MPSTAPLSPSQHEDIGLNLSRQSRYHEAYAAFHDAHILRRTASPLTQDTIWLNNLDGLGLRLFWDEHYAASESYLRESLAEKEKHADSRDGLWTGQTRVHLARALSAQGKQGEAEGLLRAALGPFCEAYGVQHERTVQIMYELAAALAQQEGTEKLDEAEALAEATLQVRKSRLGPAQQETLESVWLVASITEKLQKKEKTLRLYERAYMGAKWLLGLQHSDTEDYWKDYVRVRKQVEHV